MVSVWQRADFLRCCCARRGRAPGDGRRGLKCGEEHRERDRERREPAGDGDLGVELVKKTLRQAAVVLRGGEGGQRICPPLLEWWSHETSTPCMSSMMGDGCFGEKCMCYCRRDTVDV
jgi:hypothetical protein